MTAPVQFRECVQGGGVKMLKKKVSPELLPVEYTGGISFDSLVLNKR